MPPGMVKLPAYLPLDARFFFFFLCYPGLLTLSSSGNWMAKQSMPCPGLCTQPKCPGSHLSGHYCPGLCLPWSLMAFQGLGYSSRRVPTHMPPPLIALTQSYY